MQKEAALNVQDVYFAQLHFYAKHLVYQVIKNSITPVFKVKLTYM